eukprot:2880318-Rhodomonas_salina.2
MASRRPPRPATHAGIRSSQKTKTDSHGEDGLFVGAGRRELQRLMDLYKVKLPDPKPVIDLEEEDEEIKDGMDVELRAA